MDVEHARTFLEIVEAGSFARAAERLNVTQSTVSMRIKALEHKLGWPLFERGRAGLALTPAGQQFQRYAAGLVRLWHHARLDVALPRGVSAALAVGGQFSLWDRLLRRWIGWMCDHHPDVAVRAEVGQSEELIRRLSEGLIDVAVVYTPQARPGLVVERLFEERLVLVATRRGARAPRGEGYVYVDWGPEFQAAHAQAFPELPTPKVVVGFGDLGLAHVLERGGSGYFPTAVVQPLIARRRLFPVAGAPGFSRPAYLMVSETATDEAWFTSALDGLRQTAADGG